MGLSRFKIAILLLLSFIAFKAPAEADLWKCGEKYTNRPAKKSNCKKIASSSVCGKKGNKYFTPSKDGVSKVVSECAPSENQSSPIVNLALVEQLNAEEQSKNGKKARTKGSLTKKKSERGFFAKVSCFIADLFKLERCD